MSFESAGEYHSAFTPKPLNIEPLSPPCNANFQRQSRRVATTTPFSSWA
jgi:hypothetical protein